MQEWLKKARDWAWLEGDPNRDRTVGLLLFGMFEVALGILSFSLAMLLLVTVSSTGLGGMKPSHFWMSMGILFCLTVWFILMGLGSMKARRWARALVLVGAWVTILLGTFALALMLYVIPEIYNVLVDLGGVDQHVAMGWLYFAVFSLLLLEVVFPLVAIGFYSLAGVQATCERKNPEDSWTDRYPLPLLAMGFISVLGSLSIIVGSSANYVVFLFGRIFSGPTGMLVVALLSGACAYVGWGAFKRNKHAWWGAYGIVLITSISTMLTFAELDMKNLYTHMNYNAEQIERLMRIDLINPAGLTFASCIWGVMACIYLVWIRDCFMPEKDRAKVKSYARRMAEEEASRPKEHRGQRMRVDH